MKHEFNSDATLIISTDICFGVHSNFSSTGISTETAEGRCLILPLSRKAHLTKESFFWDSSVR